MKQKRLSTFGIVLILLLAFVVVACGPAVPPGMEDEYEAIMSGEDDHGEESHDADEDSHGEDSHSEEADSHADDGDAAHAEETMELESSAMPPISDRMPVELSESEYTESDTGLLYYDIVEGVGDSPADGAIVDMNYAIWVEDPATGALTIIDDSFAFGQPLTFIIGSQQVFDGWEEGALGMKPGGTRQLVIPPALAFGEQGVPQMGIGPDTNLMMEIELLEVQPAPMPVELSEDDFETTDSGLQIAVLADGEGEDVAEFGDTVTMEFTIWVADSGRFFTGSSTAGQPFTFPIGSGAVFPGWDEGATGMAVGEKRQLLVPAELGLGEESVGEIVPANSDLLLEVELVDLVKPRRATEVDESEYEETDTGLKYYDLVEGDGDMPEDGQIVVVHYTGWLEDGTQFDSSLDRGTPFEFPIGQGSVIPGWDEGVATMKVGGTRQLVIPSDLAYGDTGAGATIPPGATLIFEVELLDLK